MKFDPFNWHEVKPNEKTQSQKGWLRVRCSSAAPLYIQAQGVEALAGVNTCFDVETSEKVTWHIDAPEGVRVFYQGRTPTATKPQGETFTNIDRMPQESGMLAEVTKAMRAFELERRAALGEIRRERDALARLKAPPLVESLAPAPAPAPEVKTE